MRVVSMNLCTDEMLVRLADPAQKASVTSLSTVSAGANVAALDPSHQLGVMERLQGAACDGMGIVVVLHDLTLASRFCGRQVLKAGGRVVGDGAPRDVLADEAAGGGLRRHARARR